MTTPTPGPPLKPWHQHTTDDDGYCDECGETLAPHPFQGDTETERGAQHG